MPGVSIALATYNGEKYLAPQLESLAKQTRLPSELIVSDDGSDDQTIAIVRDFANDSPFLVRILCNGSRLGYRENFMRAVANCRSDLIAFCDQDDVWEPEKLAVMEAPFHDPDVLLAYHNAVVIDEDGGKIGHLYKRGAEVRRFAPLTLDPWNLVSGFTQVFRRRLTRFAPLHAPSIDPFWPAERMAHDQWYLFLANTFGSVFRVSRPLVRYRQHGGNVFGRGGSYWFEMPPGYYLRTEGFVRAAANRAQILRDMPAGLGADELTCVREAVAFYDELHQRLDERISMYSATGLLARAKAFYALLRRNAYSAGGATRLGWKGLLMDAYGGVLFGPIVKRLFA